MSTTEADSISKAIKSSVDELNDDELLKQDEETSEETDETKEAEKSEDEESDEQDEKQDDEKNEDKDDEKKDEELSETDLADAVALFKGLNDPDKAQIFAELIAKRAGLKIANESTETKDTKDETKSEEVKSAEEHIKEALGKKNAFLAPILVPAIINATETIVEERIKGLRESFDSRETKTLTQEINTARDNLFDSFTEAKKLAPEISSIIKSGAMPKPDNQSWEKYFEDILFVAAGRKNITPTRKTKVNVDKKKASRTRKDAASRLASESVSDANKKETKTEDQSIKEIIESSITEAGL